LGYVSLRLYLFNSWTNRNIPRTEEEKVGRRFCEGPKQCNIAFVGEAPAKTELALGRPFVGYDGQQLTELLHSIGIARGECFVTNTIHEYVEPKTINRWIWTDTKGVVHTSAKYDEYAAQLEEELKGLQCNVIVPLGNPALYAVTGKFRIGRWRGSILTAKWSDKQKVIPTIHPGSIREDYLTIHPVRRDLQKIKVESQFPEVRLPKRSLIVRPTFLECLDYLRLCREHPRVAFDIEVHREQVSCISFAYSPYHVISIPFFLNNGEDYFNPLEETEIWHAIATLLADPNIAKIGHNTIFDAEFLFNRYGIITEPIEDTMIAQAIAFPDLKKSLDFITSIYTNEPYYKDDLKKWVRMYLSEEVLWEYNAKDSAVTIECYDALMKELALQNNMNAYRLQVSLIPPLIYMMRRGMKVDVEGLAKERENNDARVAQLEEELNQVAGHPINPRSPQQLKDLLYKERKNKAYTKKGKVTTDETALKRLARNGDAAAKILLEHRKAQKLKSSYLGVNLDSDNRLRSSMNPVGTKSGRFSSSKSIFDTGLNVQTLPDVMRKYIVADFGYLLYTIDLAQAENRIVAYIAPEPAMVEAFESGKDVHCLTASLMSGIPPDEIKKQDKEGIFCPLGGGNKTWRFWGKKSNHSLNYDEGYKEFALINEIPERDAKFIVDTYHKIYPGVRSYHAWIRDHLSKGRTIIDPFGKRRIFLDRWDRDLFKEAYSHIPQSTVAHIINKRGILTIWLNQQTFNYVEILNQVHDSIVFQIPISTGLAYHARVLFLIKKALEQSVPWHDRDFAIPADISVGYDLSSKMKVDGSSLISILINLQQCYGKLTENKDAEESKRLDNGMAGVHEEQRESTDLSQVDSNLNDSSLYEEEVLP